MEPATPDQRPQSVGPRPRGATAITAGVLALLGALFHLAGVAGGLLTASDPASGGWHALVGIGGNAVLAGLLGAGGVLLCLRKPAGRVCTVLGCVGAMLMYILFATAGSALPRDSGGSLPIGGVALVLTCAPALAAAGLAVSPPSSWWLRR